MKRFFFLLLVTSLFMTVMVACGDDNKKGDKTNGTSGQNPVFSEGSVVGATSGGMTSEELDAWGNVSIGIETSSKEESTNSKEQTSVSESISSEAVSSKTESQNGSSSKDQASKDKDEGFGDWTPIG